MEFAREQTQERGLAGAVEAHQSQARAGRKREAQIPEQRSPTQFLRDVVHRQQPLAATVGGGEIDLGDAFRGTLIQIGELANQAAGVVDPRLRFPGARLGAAPQPLHLAAHAVGQGFLMGGLRQQKGFFLLQKLAVAALDAV